MIYPLLCGLTTCLMQIFANANVSWTRQNLLRSSLMEGDLVMKIKTVYNREVLITYSKKAYPD